MKVVYPVGSGNVGDELNAWMWSQLLSGFPGEDVALLGVGTLLNRQFCGRLQDMTRILVLGTGAGYGELPSIDARWRFYAVRGARTAAKLGLPAHAAVADAAYLLATLDWELLPRKSSGVVVVPHHRSLRLLDWETLCADCGLTFLSPLLPADVFLQGLRSADLVLAEAMHGAILADILRVPWRALSFGRHFNTDKWFDWSEAFDLPLEIATLQGFYDPSHYLSDKSALRHLGTGLKAGLARSGLGKGKWSTVTPPGWPVKSALGRLARELSHLAVQEGQLSSGVVLEARVSQLYERLDDMRRDHGLGSVAPLKGDPSCLFSPPGVVQ